jgi:hypothetical protein
MANKTMTAALVAATAAGLATAAAYAAGGTLRLGPAAHTAQVTYQGYYDSHKDAYLVTDISSKSQATALHVNYSAALGAVMGAPAQYFVKGRAAAGQLAVFGSEPGEKDYNPLWEERFVTWNSGATPVLLTSDNQINGLAKAGRLTNKDAHIVLNAPITKVGK